MNNIPKEITDGYNTIQADEALDNLADAVVSYYHKLLNRGFTKEQAFILTRDWQATMTTMAKK